MPLRLIDRILTIVITATLVSAGWIVFGAAAIDGAEQLSGAAPDRTAARGAPVQRFALPWARRARAVAAPTPGPGSLTIPVAGIGADALASTFYDDRGAGTRAHHAIDVMAPAGTPVVAAAAGRLEQIFESHDGGHTLYIRSPDRRTIYYYAHLAAYARGLREGMAVRRGQMLGAVGSSGNADPAAPHLHFAVMRTRPGARWSDQGVAVDPYPLLTGRQAPAPPPTTLPRAVAAQPAPEPAAPTTPAASPSASASPAPTASASRRR